MTVNLKKKIYRMLSSLNRCAANLAARKCTKGSKVRYKHH